MLSGPATLLTSDVHGAHGLSCVDCHGGDPTAGLEDLDPDESHDRGKGFVGRPRPRDVPALCGRCHADPLRMARDQATLPTNQLALYQTSIHGQRLAAGNDHSATCSSCHRAHGIYAPADPRSSVHPSQEPRTCGACHASAERMGQSTLPRNQLAGYETSVHGLAAARGDRSSPVCHDCHGNHAMVPLVAMPAVCQRCHAAERDLVAQGCHSPGAPGASGTKGCVICHGSHRVQAATAKMLASAGPCARCHRDGTKGLAMAQDTARSLQVLDDQWSALEQVAVHWTGRRSTGPPGASQELPGAEAEQQDTRVLARSLAAAVQKIGAVRPLVHTDDAARIRKGIDTAQAAISIALGELAQLEDERDARKALALALALLSILGALGAWAAAAIRMGPAADAEPPPDRAGGPL